MKQITDVTDLIARLVALIAIYTLAASVASSQTLTVLTHQVFDPDSPLIQGLDGDFYGAQPGGAIFKVTPEGTLTIVHSFSRSEGTNPGPLLLATDGNFYGSTNEFGPNGFGGIFKLTPSGILTIIHGFQASDGENPLNGGLAQGSNGDLYGTTYEGGEFDGGTAYKISLDGVFEKLYDFPKHSGPIVALIRATDGNFYGVTQSGGSTGTGTVFRMTPAGAVTTLHNFGSENDGGWPLYGLVQASNGKLYGTVTEGPGTNQGAVYEITTTGLYTLIYSFDFGSGPECSLIQATNGKLYGTTYGGGTHNGGTVFEITTAGALTTLYSFCADTGEPDDCGSLPEAGLFQATNGLLYGTTGYGEWQSSTNYEGEIFNESVGLGAFVQSIPTFGPTGTKVIILGTDLTGTTSVSFNGTPAVFTVVSPTEITTTVPAGARTGEIQVVTPGATLFSKLADFRVTPVISSFAPASGPVGTNLVITGSGFLEATRVTFSENVIAPSFTVNSDAQITVMVPSGAKTGPVQVTTPGGTATSSQSFTVM